MIGVASSAPKRPGLVIVNVPPRDLVGQQPLGSRPLGEVRDPRGQPLVRELVGVAHHRHDQAVVAERDRDAEVHLLVHGQAVALERRVQLRVLPQRGDGRRAPRRAGSDSLPRAASMALMSASTTVVQ